MPEKTRTTTSKERKAPSSPSATNSSAAIDLIFHPSALLADLLSYVGPDGISKLRNFPFLRKRMSQLSTQDLMYKVGGLLPYDLNVPLSNYIIRVLRAVLLESSSSSTTSTTTTTLTPMLQTQKRAFKLSYIAKLALANSSLANDSSLHKLCSVKSKNMLPSPQDDERFLRIVEAVANNPNASSHVLDCIARQEMKRQRDFQSNAHSRLIMPFCILEAVAKHSNTSPQTLHLLSSSSLSTDGGTTTTTTTTAFNNKYTSILALVARNTNTSQRTLSNIYTSSSSFFHVLTGIATNPNSSSDNLLALSQHKDAYIRSSVAGNIRAPVSILEHLARTDVNFQVRLEVAGNTSLPPELLEELSLDYVNYAIRINVAGNVNASVETLRRLVFYDEVLDVALAALENPKLNVDDLLWKEDEFLEEVYNVTFISNSSSNNNNNLYNVSFQRRILILSSKSTNPTLLEKISRFITEKQQNETTTTATTTVNDEYKHCIQMALVQNIHTSETALTHLIKSSDEKIRGAIARNPNTPISILAILSQDAHHHVRSCVAKNKNTTSFILSKLSTDADPGVIDYVVTNPNTSGSSLSVIAKHAIKSNNNNNNNDDLAVLVNIAEHGNTTCEILALLSRNEWSVVRGAVARNSRLPAFHLKELSFDGAPSVIIRGLCKNGLVQRVADLFSSRLLLCDG